MFDLDWAAQEAMGRPTPETHCPACLDAWYALGIVDECEHDRDDYPEVDFWGVPIEEAID